MQTLKSEIFIPESEADYLQISLDFVRHIFEDQYEMGLDYIQMLCSNPTQKLPILCLVGNGCTGKSTFARWLNHVVNQNLVFVRKSDIMTDFNQKWAENLLICLDEGCDKQCMDKIKALSAADRLQIESRGFKPFTVDFIGKFIILSNDEDHFMYDTDNLSWVRRVKQPTIQIVGLESHLINGIPAFLHFLKTRTLSTKQESRLWFNPKLFVNHELNKARNRNRATLENHIRSKIQSMFEDFSENIILMTRDDIMREFFENYHGDGRYLIDILRTCIKVDHYWHPDPHPLDPDGKIYVQKRYSYPKWVTGYIDGSEVTLRHDVKRVGRPFVFLRPDFVPAEREAVLQHDPEFLAMATPVPEHYRREGMIGFNTSPKAL